MNFLNWISDFVKEVIGVPKTLILILLSILIFQTVGSLFYIRALHKSIQLADTIHQDKTQKIIYTRRTIAHILKGLNMSINKLCQNCKRSEIDSLNNLIGKEEDDLKYLRIRLAELQIQSTDTTEILQLSSQLAFKEELLEYYKEKKFFREKRFKESEKLINLFGRDSLTSYLAYRDSIDMTLNESPPQLKPRTAIAVEIEDNSHKNIKNTGKQSFTANLTEHISPRKQITTEDILNSLTDPLRLQSQPKDISREQMKSILKKYDLFDFYWNENGHGFDNQFELQILEGERVVLDQASGLMWQQGGSLKYMTYRAAKEWIEKLNYNNYASYDDWRLPTLEEAMSLMEREKNQDGFYINPIFDSRQVIIWTSDLLKKTSRAWIVKFNYGNCNSHEIYRLFFIRAVRSIGVVN